jgi:hypothetical protein
MLAILLLEQRRMAKSRGYSTQMTWSFLWNITAEKQRIWKSFCVPLNNFGVSKLTFIKASSFAMGRPKTLQTNFHKYLFGCGSGQLPFKYLGIPLNHPLATPAWWSIPVHSALRGMCQGSGVFSIGVIRSSSMTKPWGRFFPHQSSFFPLNHRKLSNKDWKVVEDKWDLIILVLLRYNQCINTLVN